MCRYIYTRMCKKTYICIFLSLFVNSYIYTFMIEELCRTMSACLLCGEFKQFNEFKVGTAPDLKLLKLSKQF